MRSQAKPLQRRYGRKAPPPPPQTVIQVRGRSARHIALRAQAEAEAVIRPPAVFRYRRQLIPFAWGLAVVLAALILHVLHLTAIAVALGILAGLALVLLTRHLKDKFARDAALAMGGGTALALPLIAALGPKPWLPLFGLGWAVLAAKYARHYRTRPEDAPPEPTGDEVIFERLAEHKKWAAQLGDAEKFPGGGRRYPIQCDGIRTTIGNVLSASENVAGAWHKPMTEAYAERDPAGITSRGYLTILGRETLMNVREWNGAGMDPQTGMAGIGRYADGCPAHMKFYTPRYGTRHALISGTTGSGKTELLNLLVFIAITSGIVPVILDPQEGQSLPFWRDRCLYAAGIDECMAMMDGLHAGMLDRSRYLSSLRWDDDGISMRGMPFFDRDLTGLPVVMCIFDEAHMLLKGDTKQSRRIVEKTVEVGRLARKTGEALELATHLPSLSELGGEQALRDMLRGGNAVSMRTANRVAAGMLGLEKDPSEIPMFFNDGRETYGLGYVSGPDNRPDAPMRSDLVPKGMRRHVPPVPALDDRFAEAMDRAMRNFGAQLEMPPVTPAAALAAVPADDCPAPGGQTGADAILAVVDREMSRGEIIIAAQDKSLEWGRDAPFSRRGVTGPLAKLVDDGKVVRIRAGVYAPARASLHLISGQASQSEANAGNSAAGGQR